MTDTFQIDIHQASTSKISSVDFNNLLFGRNFTDHMLVCDYVDGEWGIPQIIPYSDLTLSPANVCLHYGQSIFEGLKAYKNTQGEMVLFRPDMHVKRFNRSAERLCMPSVSDDLFIQGIAELVKLEKNWFPQTEGGALYIRPFMIATDNMLGVNVSQTYKFLVIISPVAKYYQEPVKVMVETKYVRASQGGTGYAKAASNYAISLYPARLAQQKGYHQLMWTDHKEHKYIEEAGTMNLMCIINNTLITPGLKDSILAGITRDTILTLAREWGMKVEERELSVEEVITAHDNGTLQEVFGTGTAAVISHIVVINYNGIDYSLPAIETRSFSLKMLKALNDLRMGISEDKHGWIYRIY